MKNKSQVSITQAAKLVGIQRSTLYRHIKEKGISLIKSPGSHPKIDISELIRIYGDSVMLPQDKELKEVQTEAEKLSDETKVEETIELHRLRDEVKHLNEIRELEKNQHELILERLEKSEEQQKRLTLLLTDQSDDKEKRAGKQELKVVELGTTIEELKKQNRRVLYELKAQRNLTLWEKVFGSKKSKPPIKKTV